MDPKKLCKFSNNNQCKVYGIDSSDNQLYEDIGFTSLIEFEDGIRMMIEKIKEEL